MDYSIIRQDTFIGQYIQYMEAVETAKIYDVFCGLWALSTAIGRSAYVDRPRLPVYLNLYGILVGDSGVTRKGANIDVTRNVINRFNELVKMKEQVMQIDGKVTPDKLEAMLGEQSSRIGNAHCAVGIAELAAVIGRSSAISGLPILLTDLFDSPSNRSSGGSLDRAAVTIRNCYITFLAASTSQWLSRAVSPDVIAGGFTSRCFFVVGDQRKHKNAWPDEQRIGSIDELAKKLVTLRTRAAQINALQMSEGALNAFKKWYDTITFSEDPYASSFSSRIDSHVLRIAGLLCINDELYVIQYPHIRNAIALVNHLFRLGRQLFDTVKLVETQLSKAIARLLDTLNRAGNQGIQQTLLYKRVRHVMTKQQFDDLLDTLHELDMVQKFVVPATHSPHARGRAMGGGPPKTVWRATQLLSDPKMLDSLYEAHAKQED